MLRLWSSQSFSQFIRPNNLKLTVYQTHDSKDTIWWLQNTKLLLRWFYLTNMFLTLLTLIAIFLTDGTLGKAFDSQHNNKDIFQNDSRWKQHAKEMLRNNHANFCTIPLKSEINDSPASTIEQLSVWDNGPAIATSSFLQLPNDSPAKQPPNPHDNPASFMSIFLSQLTIVPTSSFLHI